LEELSADSASLQLGLDAHLIQHEVKSAEPSFHMSNREPKNLVSVDRSHTAETWGGEDVCEALVCTHLVPLFFHGGELKIDTKSEAACGIIASTNSTVSGTRHSKDGPLGRSPDDADPLQLFLCY